MESFRWILDMFSQEERDAIGTRLEGNHASLSLVAFLERDPCVALFFLDGRLSDISKGCLLDLRSNEKFLIHDIKNHELHIYEDNVLLLERLKNNIKPFLPLSNTRGLIHLGEMCLLKKDYVLKRISDNTRRRHGRGWTYKNEGYTARSR